MTAMTLMAPHLSGGRIEVNLPSGATLLALTPVLLIVLGLVVFSLVDVVRSPSVKYLPKAVWALIIVLGSAPLGAIVYLVVGRDRQSKGRSQSPKAKGQQVVPAHSDSDHLNNSVVVAPDRVSLSKMPGSAQPPEDEAVSPVVKTVGLTRDYSGAGLFDVDLTVPQGCIYGLVGPNGAGKTTMLSILSGLRRADSGTVQVTVPRNQIAVCPDVPDFDGWLFAREVVQLSRALSGATVSEIKVADALRVAGLADEADVQVGQFSRGMTQRLGLACAIVGDPQLLILDEPTSALDPAGRAEMLDLVSGMRGTRTVVFSSHILADVQRVADRVGILRHGRMLYQGPTRSLIDDHLQPRWLVRVAGDPGLLRAELGVLPWVTRVDPVGPDALRVEAMSVEAGERGIPVALADCHQRLISCEPVAADLESAFLALMTT